MKEIQKRVSALPGEVELSYIEDGKYKTNYMNVYFSLPLTAYNTTALSLISKILKRGCEKYPSMADLNSALDMNYASTISLSSGKEGERAVFLVSMAMMKNSFAPNGEDIFKEALDIAFETLTNPLTEGNAFKRVFFDSERKNLEDSILSQINNKAAYSRTRFIKAMFEGEPFSVNGEGDIDILRSLTETELYDFYRRLLCTAECKIYFVGSEDETRVKELLSEKLSRIERRSESHTVSPVTKTSEKTREVKETLDINQGHLWIGYRVPTSYSDPNYLKFVLFNMVLGGDVSGKMFMNIREKMSLCYTCYSSLDATVGALYAYAGIDHQNKEKTLNAFLDELESIKSGKVSEKEIEDAKKSYVNRMREICDNPSLLAPWFHMRGDAPRDPLQDAEAIKELTLEDIVWAAEQIVQDTVYFLTKG